MEHDGHRERLRERFKKDRGAGFAPHELLELLLTYAIPRVNTNPLAHQLISHFGSFHAVLDAKPEELMQVKGIGPQAAVLLSMFLPLLRQYDREKKRSPQQFKSFGELADYCHTLFIGENNEQLHLLCFDARLRLMADEVIASGTPDQVSATPRLIVQALMRHNAVGCVLVHNHPSGSPFPSPEDIDLTNHLQSILDGLDIRLYDHIIIAGHKEYSFTRDQLMPRDQASLFEEENNYSMAADKPLVRMHHRSQK